MNNLVRCTTGQWINFLIHDEGMYEFDGTLIHFSLTKRVVHPRFIKQTIEGLSKNVQNYRFRQMNELVRDIRIKATQDQVSAADGNRYCCRRVIHACV